MTHSLRISLVITFSLLLWQGLILVLDLPKFILPAPWQVAQTLWKSRALLAEHALITISEVLAGLVLGAVIGGATAIWLASSKTAELLVRPLLVFSQTIPVFALAPLLTLWLGYGLLSKIAMALLIIFFPVTSAFYDALLQTPSGFLGLAKVMGASKWQIMRQIRIPAALPGFASGLRLAAVYAPIGAIIGEWVGASRGLGYLMLLANGRAKIDLMFAALLVLAAFTMVLHATVDRLCTRFLRNRA